LYVADARADARADGIDGSNLKEEENVGEAYNGIPAGRLHATGWRKSQRSSPSGNCVELTTLADSPAIAVRNSRDPKGPALLYTRAEIAAFVQGAKDGDFDDLIA